MAQSAERGSPVALIPVRKYAIEKASVTILARNLVVSQNHADIRALTPVMHHSNAQKLRHVNLSYTYRVLVVALSKRSDVTSQSHLQEVE